MRKVTLLPKRIFKQIGFSVATIALGVVLWSNVPQVQEAVSTAEQGICMPGYPHWPECRSGQDKGSEIVSISNLQPQQRPTI